MNKLEALRNLIKEMVPEGICLAVSGGVDSTLLLALLGECAGNFSGSILAVSFLTGLQSQEDRARIEALGKRHSRTEHNIVFLDLLSDPDFANNPPDRCYRCKRGMFSSLRQIADSKNLKWILDGTQTEDLASHRPGLKALEAFQVRSPLAECGMGKEDVRHAARSFLLSAADLPSGACLATRLPHGATLDPEILQAIDEKERFLRHLGFPQVRIRLHGDLARIEVPLENFPALLRHRPEICEGFKNLPVRHLCLDLAGFSSGSMDPL